MYPGQMNIRENYRQAPDCTRRTASPGSAVSSDSYPISEIISESTLSCSGSSSRIQGVSEPRGATPSIVLVSTFPTPPLSQLYLHSPSRHSPLPSANINLIKARRFRALQPRHAPVHKPPL